MPILSSIPSSKGFSAMVVNDIDDEPEYKNTIMIFPQATAPTGWIKAVGINDYGLRITSGATLSDGVGNPFSTAYPATYNNFGATTDTWPLSADTHFTTLAEMPAHQHMGFNSAAAGTGGIYSTGPTAFSLGSMNVSSPLSLPSRAYYYGAYYISPGGTTSSPGEGHSHSFDVSIRVLPNPSSINLNVKYVAAIIAKRTKNANWYDSPY